MGKVHLDFIYLYRQKIAQLLKNLNKCEVVTSTQMAQGFRKLFDSLDELMVDVPQSKVSLLEYLGHANAAGYLEPEVAATLEKEVRERNAEYRSFAGVLVFLA